MSTGCDVALLANRGCAAIARAKNNWDVLVTATKKYDLIGLPEEG
jgi:hypothetical protein